MMLAVFRRPRSRRAAWLGVALHGLVAWLFPSRFEVAPAMAARQMICDRLVEDFRSTPLGSFPRGWRPKDDDDWAVAIRSYAVRQVDGRRALHAKYGQAAVTIGRALGAWDLDRHAVLQWEWRAVQLPAGGNEDSLGANDCAASVYAFWDVGFPFYVDSMKFSWSSTLPKGTHLSKTFGHHHVFVQQSGARQLGKWRRVSVDVGRHHDIAFAGNGRRSPGGIALLTDADGTSSAAEAFYANFRLCRYVQAPAAANPAK